MENKELNHLISREFWRIMNKLEPDFEMEDAIQPIYDNVISYFIKGKGDYHPAKGLYIYGGIGSGKTILMRAMRELTNRLRYNTFIWMEYSKVSKIIHEGVTDNGITLALIESVNTSRYAPFKPQALFIDDFGRGENKTKYYGSESFPAQTLLERRYDVFIEAHKPTHITSNLRPDEIGKIYGPHISSRFSEMFTAIAMPTKDYRKKDKQERLFPERSAQSVSSDPISQEIDGSKPHHSKHHRNEQV